MPQVNYAEYFQSRKYRVHVSENMPAYFPDVESCDRHKELSVGCVAYLQSCGHMRETADYLTGALSWFDEYLQSFEFVDRYEIRQSERLPNV